jgi:hypothetical protein
VCQKRKEHEKTSEQQQQKNELNRQLENWNQKMYLKAMVLMPELEYEWRPMGSEVVSVEMEP